jgi:hypothetical protein
VKWRELSKLRHTLNKAATLHLVFLYWWADRPSVDVAALVNIVAVEDSDKIWVLQCQSQYLRLLDLPSPSTNPAIKTRNDTEFHPNPPIGSKGVPISEV